MVSIDKNDVDISKLFRWSKEVNLMVYGNPVKFYIRLVGDAELNRARVYALRRSAELRRKLRDENSDESIAFLPAFDLVTNADLINGMLALSVREVTSEADDKTRLPLPVEPGSDATLEQQESYQRELDEYPIKRDIEMRKYIEERLTKLEKSYYKMSKEVLFKNYIDKAINQLCELEMLNAFREMCAYFGTYSDPEFKIRFFDSIEKISELPTDTKTDLIQEYLDLEIDGEVLKKSLGQTQ